MIPRLYSKDETSFTNYGICPLVDAISCDVTEERNGGFTLSMTYAREGRFAKELTVDRIILADPHEDADQAEPFRINDLGYDMNGDIVVEAEHISYQLNHIVVGPFSGSSTDPADVWDAADDAVLSTSQPFTFSTDITAASAKTYGRDEPTQMRSVIGGSEGSLLDLFGGELEWNRYTVKLWSARGSNNGVRIAYTKNLTGLEYSIDMSNVYTGVIAYWKDENNYVESDLQTIANTYSFSRDKAVDASEAFESVPTKAQLNSWAAAYLSANAKSPSVSVDVEFVPLWQTEEYKRFYNLEHVDLCDTVTVIYPPLNLSIESKVVKTVYDVLRDRYKGLTISTIRETLADTIYSLMKENS